MTGLLTWFGDDFTGSSDVVLQYTRAGVPALLFLRTPTADELQDAARTHAAIGIAGVTRSLPTDRIGPVVREAFELLAGLRPRAVQYKICSTADSAVEVGSIGPAVEVGRELFGAAPVPILAAQPDLGRYTVFGNHFGRDATGVHRLDRLPSMANHPVTPMTEADLRRHFAAQLGAEVHGLPLTTLRSGGGPAVLADLRAQGAVAYVVDGFDNDDLRAAGKLLVDEAHGCLFAVGSGGLSTALAAAGDTSRRAAAPHTDQRAGAPSSCLVVSGSAARRTTEQIDRAVAAGWRALPLDPALLASGSRPSDIVDDVARQAVAAFDEAAGVIVYTAHAELLPPVARVESSVIGAALGDVVRAVRAVVDAPRVVVAGGDTSGYVLTRLQASTLSAIGTVGDDLLLGVLGADDKTVDGLEVVLKGGQLGGLDVFEQALRDPA